MDRILLIYYDDNHGWFNTVSTDYWRCRVRCDRTITIATKADIIEKVKWDMKLVIEQSSYGSGYEREHENAVTRNKGYAQLLLDTLATADPAVVNLFKSHYPKNETGYPLKNHAEKLLNIGKALGKGHIVVNQTNKYTAIVSAQRTGPKKDKFEPLPDLLVVGALADRDTYSYEVAPNGMHYISIRH